ncbi:hypothetical protein BX616_008479, partial [Lobosporangium transversale]
SREMYSVIRPAIQTRGTLSHSLSLSLSKQPPRVSPSSFPSTLRFSSIATLKKKNFDATLANSVRNSSNSGNSRAIRNISTGNSTATASSSSSSSSSSSTPTLATNLRSIPPALPNKTIRSILATAVPDSTVKVQGWVRSARHQKNITFVELNDGSSLKGVQAILSGGEGKG